MADNLSNTNVAEVAGQITSGDLAKQVCFVGADGVAFVTKDCKLMVLRIAKLQDVSPPAFDFEVLHVESSIPGTTKNSQYKIVTELHTGEVWVDLRRGTSRECLFRVKVLLNPEDNTVKTCIGVSAQDLQSAAPKQEVSEAVKSSAASLLLFRVDTDNLGERLHNGLKEIFYVHEEDPSASRYSDMIWVSRQGSKVWESRRLSLLLGTQECLGQKPTVVGFWGLRMLEEDILELGVILESNSNSQLAENSQSGKVFGLLVFDKTGSGQLKQYYSWKHGPIKEDTKMESDEEDRYAADKMHTVVG